MLTRIAVTAVVASLLSSFALGADKPTLNVLTYKSMSSEWGPGPQLKADFEKQCQCELNWMAATDAVVMLSRMKLEGSALKADVVMGLDNNTIGEAQATGLVATLPKPLTTRFGSTDTFVPFDYSYLAFIKRRADKLPDIDSLTALSQAPNTFTIAVEDPRTSSVGQSFLGWVDMNVKNQDAFWRDLKPKIKATTPGWSQAYKLFTHKNVDMVLSYTTSPLYHELVEKDTQYEAILFKEPHYQQIEYAFMLKSAPHKALAEQFLAFLLTQEAQKTLAMHNWMYPVIEGVDLPENFLLPAGLKGEGLAPENAKPQLDKALEIWKRVMLAS